MKNVSSPRMVERSLLLAEKRIAAAPPGIICRKPNKGNKDVAAFDWKKIFLFPMCGIK